MIAAYGSFTLIWNRGKI